MTLRRRRLLKALGGAGGVLALGTGTASANGRAGASADGTTLNDGQAEVVGTDFEASNGVVHVVDGVLLP